MTEWPATKIEMRPIESLIAYARNSRKHSQKQIDQVAASIREFGWTIPVLIAEDNTIIAGHCRVLSAKKLGITEVPTMMAKGWSEAQRRAYVISDNQLTLLGEFDEDLLKLELLDLKNSHFDLSLIGFDSKELDRLLVSDEPTQIDEDEPSEVQSETTIKLGDLFILGNHRVLCGDNSDPENVKRLFNGETPDACISDPPYGINFNTDYTRFTIERGRNNKHKPINDDHKSFNPKPYLDYKSVVLFGANYFAEHLPVGTWLVWDKRYENGTAWLSDAELAWMKGGTGVYIKHIIWQGFARSDLKGFSTTSDGIKHPTQKPVALMMWCMEKSKAGELIFDPFLGSGTTLMAAEQLGKRCFGMEIEPTYVQVIVDRWEKMSNQKAILEKNDG